MFCNIVARGNVKDIVRNSGDKAIEHLEQKYGVEVTPFVYETGDFMSSTDEVRFYGPSIDETCEHGTVYILKENGDVKYVDNYFGYLVREEYERIVTSMVCQEFKEAKVFAYRCESLPDNFNNEDMLQEALDSGEQLYSSLRIFVEANQGLTQEAFEEKCNALTEKMKKENIGDWFYFYQVGSNVVDKLTRANYMDYFDLMNPDGEEYIRKSY